MLQIHLYSSNKDKLSDLSYMISDSLVGWESYINSEVLVSSPANSDIEIITESGEKTVIPSMYNFVCIIGPDTCKHTSTIMINMDQLWDNTGIINFGSSNEELQDICKNLPIAKIILQNSTKSK